MSSYEHSCWYIQTIGLMPPQCKEGSMADIPITHKNTHTTETNPSTCSKALPDYLVFSSYLPWFGGLQNALHCCSMLQQLFTSFAPCPHISWRCFTWSEQNSQAVEPHIVWRNQARMSAAFLKTIWKLLLLQLFDNRPIVCLKQVEYVGGKSQNIAESFQTQMTGTWFVYCARFILQGKSGKLVIWCMESHQENRTSWKSVFQSSLQIYHSGIEISFWYRTIIILLTKYRLLYLTCFVWFL